MERWSLYHGFDDLHRTEGELARDLPDGFVGANGGVKDIMLKDASFSLFMISRSLSTGRSWGKKRAIKEVLPSTP